MTELKNNEEFEKNNAEFCNNFLDDMKTRSKAIEKKKTTAESLRLKGNQYYKKKDFSSALSLYNEALKMFPYSEKTIMNMAQCYIRLAQMDEALEFLSRVIYLDESHAKVRSKISVSIRYIYFAFLGVESSCICAEGGKR